MKEIAFPAPGKKRGIRFARSFLMLWVIFFSCVQKKQDLLSLPLIRILQEEISLTDSSNAKILPGSQIFVSDVAVDTVERDVYHVTFSITLAKPQKIRDLEIRLRVLPDSAAIWKDVKNSFHWIPNLKKRQGQIVAQPVFRSPAIILTHGQSGVSIIPDLREIKNYPSTPYYLDLKFGNDGIIVSYGLSNYVTTGHVYYARKDSAFILPSKIKLGLYIVSSNHSSADAIVRKTNALLWQNNAIFYRDSISPQIVPFRHYAEAGYGMALQKYWVDGPSPGKGGITLSTFFDKTSQVYGGRDYKDDIWFHSWFNNARTAYGLYLWGKETENKVWTDKALEVMNLLLTSPQQTGFFPTIWVPEKKGWVSSGQGGGPGLYHVPDNAWTAIWLLRFDDELISIPTADKFLRAFANALLKTQLPNGSFPALIHTKDLSPDPVLANSASGSMATWFLEEMLLRKRLPAPLADQARQAVKRSLSFLEREVLPGSKFHDFEVFFSCAPNSPDHFDSLTWLYPHNTLSIQWSAEAFLKGYQLFHDNGDLELGEHCLNLLSLYQQVWNPPFIDFYAFGGFGVQNTDAEWSDARQAQFAETYLNFFLATGNREYLERSVAAARASFALMAIPENRWISPQNYQGTSYNGEFIGAMAENFGHSGYNERSGQSGFHWGTGSALTTAIILKTKLGDIYVDDRLQLAMGIDGIVVTKSVWNDTIRLKTKKLDGLRPLRIKGSIGVKGRQLLIDVDRNYTIQ